MTTNDQSQNSVGRVFDAMDTIAPPAAAESWDKNGLQIGSRRDTLKGPVLLAIDLTDAVLDEAIRLGSNAVIAYHPTMFEPPESLTDEHPHARLVLAAARAGVNVYSPHTALDSATNGLNDWLARGIAFDGDTPSATAGDVRALEPWAKPEDFYKLVTFVPIDDAPRVRDALATAGAGRIGEYTECSFSVEGTGTFMGGKGTNPTVGKAGHLESVKEARLELVCPARAAALAIQTLREFHPYEEPAIDLVRLAPKPQRNVGLGRRVVLDRPATPSEIAQRFKAFLRIDAVKLAVASSDTAVSTVGVCAGAGGSVAPKAANEGCELFVTGEMRHHETLAMVRRGMSVLLCGHTNTERPYLPVLADRLKELLPETEFSVSGADRSPFGWV